MKQPGVPPQARSGRHRATRIDSLEMALIETDAAVDPEAVMGALQLIVKWAVRANKATSTDPSPPVTAQPFATYVGEN